MDIARLPKNLVVLYEPRDTHRRGPKPALSLDGVIAAAVEIADAEGLAGVSMAKVAERLGFTTMSLYRYVKSKDDLLLLMADTANQEQAPVATPESWRTGLETWAKGIFGIYRAHPWLLQVPVSGPPAGPAQLVWMDAGLQNLASLELHEGFKLQIIQLLHGYARGEAQLSTDLSGLDPATGTSASYGAILRAVVDPETHPALSRLMASGILDGPTAYDEDVDFGFGLGTILDGVEQLVGSAVGPSPARTGP
jgi:AcrR family transcriptional regulator